MTAHPARIDVHHHVIPPDYALLLRDKGIQPGGIPLPSWAAPVAAKVLHKNGIRTAILSLSTPGVWFGDGPEARHWARWVNEFAAGVVAAQPDRFGFFATLTLPDVDGAIAEAASRGLHPPGELPAEPVPGIPTFTADFLLDTTRTAISLILSGALEKYDGIRFILAHAGGFVPYVAHRLLLTTLRDEPGLR